MIIELAQKLKQAWNILFSSRFEQHLLDEIRRLTEEKETFRLRCERLELELRAATPAKAMMDARAHLKPLIQPKVTGRKPWLQILAEESAREQELAKKSKEAAA